MPMEPDIPTTTVTGVKKKEWSIGEKTGVCLTVLAALALICEIANMGWSIGGQTGWYLTLIAALALICGKKGWSKGEKTGVCLAVIAALALICGGWSTGVKTGVCLTVIVALIALIFSSSHLKNASYSCLLKCFRILEKRRKSDPRSADAPLIPMVDKDALFDELSKKFPARRYSTFCKQMGVSFNEAKSILKTCKEDYNDALRDVLSQWDHKMNGVTKKQLEDALDGAEVVGLCSIVRNYYEKGVQKSAESVPLIPMVNKAALFNELSEKFPARQYSTFCKQIGVSFNEAKSILKTCKEDYNVALRDVLSQWDHKMNGVTKKQLEDALDGAEVGALCYIVRKHYEKASTEDLNP